MADIIEELKKDTEELRQLLTTATRSRVKDALGFELGRIEKEIQQRESGQYTETEKPTTQVPKADPHPPVLDSAPTSVQKKPLTVVPHKINNYAWDQSEKFVKIYASLQGVQDLPEDKVKCEFGPNKKSFKLQVSSLHNKHYELYISTLFDEIVPKESYHKVKKDNVLIMLKKKNTGKTWAYVTEREKKDQDKKKPKMDDDGEPTDSLMNMMKQMYDDGDDEMKRTIAKAWTESRDKKKEP